MKITPLVQWCNLHSLSAPVANSSHSGRPHVAHWGGGPQNRCISRRPFGGVTGAAAAARGRFPCGTYLISFDFTTAALRATLGGIPAEPGRALELKGPETGRRREPKLKVPETARR